VIATTASGTVDKSAGEEMETAGSEKRVMSSVVDVVLPERSVAVTAIALAPFTSGTLAVKWPPVTGATTSPTCTRAI
jgi:hypothetical protein